MQDITKELAELWLELDDIEQVKKAKEARYKELAATLKSTLELLDVEKLEAHGFLFYKKNSTSVKLPETMEQKQALFEYLRTLGLFDEIVSVNSRTLNKLYKDQAELAAKEGNFDFKIPGVGEPTSFTTLELRRK